MVAKESDGYPTPSSPAVTAAMKGNRRANTRPENRLRSALHAAGYRFRKDYPLIASGRKCRPDIVFTRRRITVFVDGCFWHSCPVHGHQPRVNEGYWRKKLLRNAERDVADSQALREGGWEVLRIWEHTPIEEAVSVVIAALERRTD